MTTAVIVQNRSGTRRLETLGMRGDEREIPSPLTATCPISYWVGFGGISGTAALLGDGQSLVPGYEVGVMGTIALALHDRRLFGIISSTDATGPAVWLAASLTELQVSSSGKVGVFNKRPQRIEIRNDEWELLIRQVQSLKRDSGDLRKARETELLAALVAAVTQ
jgi:hypothetical protein